MSKIDFIRKRHKEESLKQDTCVKDVYYAVDIENLLTHIDSLEEQLSDFKGLYENSKEQRREIITLKQKLAKATKALEFVVKNSGTSCEYNHLARTTLAEIGEQK